MTAKRRLTDFTPDERNANRHTQRGMSQLETSLRTYGAGRSILVDRNNKVIAGNATLETAVDIGLDGAIVVPTDGKQLVVVQRTDLDIDSPEGRGLALSDNRIASVNLEWDGATLAASAAEGVDLSALWNDDELAALIGASDEPKGDPGAQTDRADELQQTWRVARGDIWIIGDHRLLCGDSTNAGDVARLMRGERADCVIADPPYGMRLDTDYTHMPETRIQSRTYEQVKGDNEDFNAAPFIQMFMDVPEQFWWGGDYYYHTLPPGGSWIVWDKRNENSDGLIGNHFEMCWSRTLHRRRMIRQHWSGVNARNPGIERAHPTEKPIAVLEEIMRDHTSDGAIILDPFLGSGTTLVACERTGRRGRGVEIEPKYVAVALDRLSKMGLTPTRAIDGRA